jgi:hypothetical protein
MIGHIKYQLLHLFYFFFQVLQTLSVQGAPGSTGSSGGSDLSSSGVSRAVINERSVPWQFGLHRLGQS